MAGWKDLNQGKNIKFDSWKSQGEKAAADFEGAGNWIQNVLQKVIEGYAARLFMGCCNWEP